MREVYSAFRNHLDQIAEAELVAEIPAHAQDNDFAVKVPPSEQLLNTLQLAHSSSSTFQKTNVSDGPEAICTRTDYLRMADRFSNCRHVYDKATTRSSGLPTTSAFSGTNL
jgi:hypothetical protein